jgi:hypothetical protein
MPIKDEWDYLPHDDDPDEDVEAPAEELALHEFEPGRDESPAPQEPPRPVRQLFPDEARDREPRDDKEHDLEYLLEVQHYAFPEEHNR